MLIRRPSAESPSDENIYRQRRQFLGLAAAGPDRLVVPWNDGLKSIKSIVRIRLMEQMPTTSWGYENQPQAFGFYSNVNPVEDNLRWSQKTERRIGEFARRKTLSHNGYAKEVAHLYTGMDPKKLF